LQKRQVPTFSLILVYRVITLTDEAMATGTTKPPRKTVPSKNETAVLIKSARRCPLCFHLSGDLTEKVGQVAHLDDDPSNGAEDNLAWMCMPHHSQYDSTTSQHKNYTLAEVKELRLKLYEAIARGERGSVPVPMTGVRDKGGERDTRENRYLFSTDTDLGSAIKMMVWSSAWGNGSLLNRSLIKIDPSTKNSLTDR
jgi:hypothetical protein